MPIILIILLYCCGWIWAHLGALAQQPRDRKATCCHGQCARHNGRAGGGQQPRLFATKQPRLWEQTQGWCCQFWTAGVTLECSLALTGSKARSDFLLLNLISPPPPHFCRADYITLKKRLLVCQSLKKMDVIDLGIRRGNTLPLLQTGLRHKE